MIFNMLTSYMYTFLNHYFEDYLMMKITLGQGNWNLQSLMFQRNPMWLKNEGKFHVFKAFQLPRKGLHSATHYRLLLVFFDEVTLRKLQIRIWRLTWTFNNKVIFITIYKLNNKNTSKQLSCNHWLKEKQCKLNK
jgi:hypothetical protein